MYWVIYDISLNILLIFYRSYNIIFKIICNTTIKIKIVCYYFSINQLDTKCKLNKNYK